MSSPWIVRVIINNCFLLCEGPKQQRTYIGWVNNFGDILVGGIDHQTGKLLPEVTIKKHLNKDDHANPSIMILQVRVTKIFTYSEVLANRGVSNDSPCKMMARIYHSSLNFFNAMENSGFHFP